MPPESISLAHIIRDPSSREDEEGKPTSLRPLDIQRHYELGVSGTADPSGSNRSEYGVSDNVDVEAITQYALPPVDGGRKAWLFLLGGTGLELLVWGLPFAIGVLLAYWTTELFPGEGTAILTLAATLQAGLLYIMAAVVGPVVVALPRWTKTLQILGILAASLSMITSAFATKPWHILVTQGLLYSFAGAAYFPCGPLLYEWFYTKRGIATGIMYAGTGVGGCIFPFIMSGLLTGLGYKKAMIILGSGFGFFGLLCLLPVQRRVPITKTPVQFNDRKPKADWSFLKSGLLMVSLSIILLTSMGNFIPSLWLPTYANDLNLTHPNGTALLAILNAASVPGNALLGYMSDRFSLRTTILTSCLGSGLAVAFLWGFGKSEGVLVVFCLVFGLLGPSFSAVWTKINAMVAKDNTQTFAYILSLFTFLRGIGNFTSGPISEALLKTSSMKDSVGGYGVGNYGPVMIYSAVMILGGGVAGAFFRERK